MKLKRSSHASSSRVFGGNALTSWVIFRALRHEVRPALISLREFFLVEKYDAARKARQMLFDVIQTYDW
jgi:hypothetical protein